MEDSLEHLVGELSGRRHCVPQRVREERLDRCTPWKVFDSVV
jgi:hypothetical protein